MIVIVAPYSPPNREGGTHLGASRKLEILIVILSKLNLQLVLVNSAHNTCVPAELACNQVEIGGVNVIEITPPISANRIWGKLKNIFCTDQVLNAVQKIGIPQCFWFYNGYAFEMRTALTARRKFQSPMILELEDWHFSRSRGLNPKPYVDYFFWRRAVRFMSAVFVVNTVLASKLKGFMGAVDLLPGIVPEVLANNVKESPPFAVNTNSINVGFFGGLSVEKGADILLKLAEMLPAGYVLHVTGAGSLSADFYACEEKFPGRLYYHGQVDHTALYKIIVKCDVILNPHSPIENMDSGVFPFKVIEAVASGRLLISTAVPERGLQDLLIGVQFVEHSVRDFYLAIIASHEHYLEYASLVEKGAVVANQRFGEDALLKKIQKILQNRDALVENLTN